jgi:L-asparaginase/beta-aspartyl-peptidase (threonine type)
MKGATVVTHGGVGAPDDWKDGPDAAAEAGLSVLRRDGGALDAAVEASVLLEDDPRFNAGTGSRIRLDGKTIEMDATVMTSDGEMGGVAALRNVRNPIRVARLVLDTPHVILAGEGAESFARRHDIPPYDPATPRAQEFLRKACEKLREGKLSPHYSRWLDFRDYDLPEFGCDTVGAVAADGKGFFAAANSTGGSAIMLPGRVGDSCHYGAGLWSGPAGAVATTGIGEFIIARLMAREVYDALARGETAQKACEYGVALYEEEIPVGVIAVAAEGHGSAANRSMPVGVGVL